MVYRCDTRGNVINEFDEDGNPYERCNDCNKWISNFYVKKDDDDVKIRCPECNNKDEDYKRRYEEMLSSFNKKELKKILDEEKLYQKLHKNKKEDI